MHGTSFNAKTQRHEDFTWDGLALIKRDSTNFVNESAVTGGNPVLAFGKDSSKVLFEDMLGSTLGSVEGGKFNAIDRSAFGESNSDSDLNFFTGKPKVEGLGYAFMFRNYRAEHGKWQSQDPIGYPDGWNNLAYCRNHVTIHIDPNGLVCSVCGSSTPTFFNNDSSYAMGRDGIFLLNPANPITNFIENYLPNAHYFAIVHDSWVDQMTQAGIPDAINNVPSMPSAYIYSFGVNSLNAFLNLTSYMTNVLGINLSVLPCCISE